MTAIVETSDTSIVRDEDVPWATLTPGVEIKMFRVGRYDNTYQMLLCAQPGAQLPTHHHFGEVHAYTISGRWAYREYEWEATAGTYVYEEPRSAHTLFVPEDADEPALVFFTIAAGMLVFLDTLPDEMSRRAEEMGVEPGQTMIQDGVTLDGLYRAVLEAAGERYPDAVLHH
ncbi:MAG: 2,4'-dihydroxyacetophenone dioxygenase family protein [Acidimicrobiia bacterium]|nr:2,4'-dihydroxyacetophenone dioxygenase family protein [Acidimicrobiia bacterium]